jgi:hypothetical protein
MFVEMFFVDVFQRKKLVDAGVVNQNIDATNAFFVSANRG